MRWIEEPAMSAPIAEWYALRRELEQEDQTDEIVQASIEDADRIIALKRELEGDDLR